MKTRETLTYQMLLRTRGFGSERNADFSTGDQARELFDIIPPCVDEVAKHNLVQTESLVASHSSTKIIAKARAALRESMIAIKRTAKVISRKIENLEHKFELPPRNDLVLLTKARQFAKEVEPLKDQFINYHMPKDFFETLQANILAMEQAIDSKNSTDRAKVAATASIKAALARGVNAVRLLDPIMRNLYKDDPGALADWETASHTERSPRPRTKSKPADKPASTAAVVEPEKSVG